MKDYYKDNNVLITGGAGFIGSNLAHDLLRRRAKVTLLDSFMKEGGANACNYAEIKNEIKLIKADLQNQTSRRHIKGFDTIFHLAGHLGHKASVQDPVMDMNNNLLATINLLEAVRKKNKDAVVIYAGTRGQYGKIQKIPADETHPIIPADPNGVSKHAAEEYCMLYSRNYGIRVASLRFTNIYGPRMRIRSAHQGFVGWFVNLALKGETITVFDQGSQHRDLLYVRDACSALMLAAENEKSFGKAFNIASGIPVSVMNVAKIIIKNAAKGSIKKVPFPEINKKVEIGDFIGDISKAKKILKWTPSVQLEKGIEKTIGFYKKNYDKYS